jgi:S-adenosylmethionine:tRNA ribosyltransferase-isomerase
MKLADFDYELPKELIAQTPVEPRDSSRLLVLDRGSQRITHDHFYNLQKYLSAEDLFVFNETKVFQARLLGKKETGGAIEILLLSLVPPPLIPPPSLGGGRGVVWNFIGRNIGRAKKVLFDEGLEGEIVQPGTIKFNLNSAELMRTLDVIGHTPLPPYMASDVDRDDPNIRHKYQTVYARELGSAAAPTAGFHFTAELMQKLPNKAFVTLHVGLGTFAPVKEENIEEHKMHSEWYKVPEETKDKLKSAKSIVAVGTTSVRTLETFANTGKCEGDTDIFIYPGYKFKKVDKMITNFHLPKSTLLMLVSAFAGRDLIMKAYEEAVKEKYRFFSFGDAMLIL